jgi:hypothetical protein
MYPHLVNRMHESPLVYLPRYYFPRCNPVRLYYRNEKQKTVLCCYNTINQIRKSKPVEKRGRKAKGLKLQTQSGQPGCRREIHENVFLASLARDQALFLEPYHYSFDKGKPVERRGRKAQGLKL